MPSDREGNEGVEKDPPFVSLSSSDRGTIQLPRGRYLYLKTLKLFRIDENAVLILQAVLVGLVCGAATIGFNYLMEWHTELFRRGASTGLLSIRVLLPAIGALLAGLVIHFGANEAKGHGVSEVMEAIAARGSRIPFRVAIVKALASALTIGSGGSAGREGPIVQIGSALGSALSNLTRSKTGGRRMLVACGAAAGIAGIFNAPIAGVFFAVEVILGTFSTEVLAPLIVSAVSASLVVRAVLGNQPAFAVPHYPLVSGREFPFYLLLGLLGGIVAAFFKKGMILSERFFHRLKIKGWFKPAIGGFLVGLISLNVPEVLGDGLSVISQALTENLPLSFFLVLLAAKLISTPLTLGSGGSGGSFMPALYLGAMLGGAIGVFANQVMPEQTASAGAYALVGMGVLVAGTTHAVITAIILVFEITNDYALILPLMAACILATLVSRRIHRETIYTEKLAEKGIRLYDGRDSETLRELRVGEVIDHDVDVLSEDTPLFTIIARYQSSRHSAFPVVNEAGGVIGLITLDDIRPILSEEEMGTLLLARDLEHTDYPFLFPGDDFLTALRMFSENIFEELPVLDARSRRLIGMVSRANVLQRYEREVFKRGLQVEGT